MQRQELGYCLGDERECEVRFRSKWIEQVMEMHVTINMLTIRRAPSRVLFGITSTIFMSLFFFVSYVY